jgi:hypothetical protein
MQLAVMALLAASALWAQAGNIDPDEKFAWAVNAGWINFAPEHGGGATEGSSGLSGYVWAENIGWIRLAATDSTYENTSADDYGVKRNGSQLSGFAWSPNAGWINFAPEHGGGVFLNGNNFAGYAWAENVGWIKLSGTAQDAADYGVALIPPGGTVLIIR